MAGRYTYLALGRSFAVLDRTVPQLGAGHQGKLPRLPTPQPPNLDVDRPNAKMLDDAHQKKGEQSGESKVRALVGGV